MMINIQQSKINGGKARSDKIMISNQNNQTINKALNYGIMK